MDIHQSNPDFSPPITWPTSAVDKCQAGPEVIPPKTQLSGNPQVTSKEQVSSLIPQHSLPGAVSKSTPPILLAPQTPVAPVSQETVQLANHVSVEIFSSTQTQNNKNVMVFLHGGPGLAYDESYEPVTKWCISHGYTLVAPEIAGSAKPGLEHMSNSHTQNYVRDLKSVIQCLRERPDMQGKEFCVVAHSWGGFQLASLLTDETAEERNFFKQAVFISPNLDSAETRLFADAPNYSDSNDGSIATFELELVSNFKERHTGSKVEMDDSTEMTILNNPLIDQSLNERFSPFYRLDKMPKDIPCLFFHASDDKNVPLSQSVNAFAKVNGAGGNASIVIASQGGHAFFKNGDTHNANVMTNCFSSINTFVKQGESSRNVSIDGDLLPESDIATVEKSLRVLDKNYENHATALQNFHNEIETAATGNQTGRIPPKRKLLGKIAKANETIAEKHRSRSTAVNLRIAEKKFNVAKLINTFLEES